MIVAMDNYFGYPPILTLEKIVGTILGFITRCKIKVYERPFPKEFIKYFISLAEQTYFHKKKISIFKNYLLKFIRPKRCQVCKIFDPNGLKFLTRFLCITT